MQNEEHDSSDSDSDRYEIIRLNNDLISINQSQIRKKVRDVLRCDNAEDIRQRFSELSIQHEDIWLKVSFVKKIKYYNFTTGIIYY